MYEARQNKNKNSRVIEKCKVVNSKNPNDNTLKSEILSNKNIQLKMNPYGFYRPMNLPSIPYNTVRIYGTQPLTGSPLRSEVFVNAEGPQTSPADLLGMNRLRSSGLLNEPNSSRTLTRMHVINGRFHGPSNCNNMVLGTAASNNSSPNSHYKEVEEPIRSFLRNFPYPRAVHYIVTPNYSPPSYIVERYLSINDKKLRNYFINWTFQGCPDILDCTAFFYYTQDGQTYGLQQNERIRTDL